MPSPGSKDPFVLVPAAPGMDATSDPAHLAPGRAQNLVNLLTDYPGQLRANVSTPNVVGTPIGNPIDGVGYWYSFGGTDTLLAASNGTLYTSSALSGFPVTCATLSSATVGTNYTPTLVAGKRVRMVQFAQDTVIVEQGGIQPGRYNGTPPYTGFYQLGMTPPQNASTNTYASLGTGGPPGKTFLINPTIVVYTFTFVDEQGRESNVSSGFVPASYTASGKKIYLCRGTGFPGNGGGGGETTINIYATVAQANPALPVLAPAYYIGNVSIASLPSQPATITASADNGSGKCRLTLLGSTVTGSGTCNITNATGGGGWTDFNGVQAYTFINATTVDLTVPYSGGYIASTGTIAFAFFVDSNPDAVVQAGQLAPNPGENSLPHTASLVNIYKGHVVLDDTTQTGTLQISNLNSATQFATVPVVVTDGERLSQYVDQGNPITGLMPLADSLAIMRARGMYELYGDNVANFAIRSINATGCIAPDSVVRCDNIILFLGDNGVFALDYASGFLLGKVSQQIDVPLRATARATLEAAVGWYHENCYHLAVGSTIYRMDSNREWSTWGIAWAQVEGAYVTQVPGEAAWVFMGRSDVGNVATVSTYLPTDKVNSPYPATVTASNITYQTARFGERNRLIQLKRCRVWGLPQVQPSSGVINSGTVTLTNDDGVLFVAPFAPATVPNASVPGVLMEWFPTTDCIGFTFDATLQMNVTNVVITDLTFEYKVVEG